MLKFIKNDISKSLKDNVKNLASLKEKTILITGGTGFIGSWSARLIVWLNDEYNFKCKIILLSRNPKKLQENDADLYHRKEVTSVCADVRSLNHLSDEINFIIHAAASPDNRIHMSDPVKMMDTIAVGTKSVMDIALRLSSLEGIVYLSSGQVYGKPFHGDETLSEDTLGNILNNNITSIYPEAKRYAETICLAYRTLHKLPISIARPFSFIGPFQDLNKPWAINSFLQEALNEQPMRIIGNGKPQRSYMYATDMAAWLLMILVKGRRGGVYNLGSSEAISLLSVTSKINAIITNNAVEVVIQNYNDNVSNFIPNLTHTKETLNVKEEFSFEEALNRTIKWNIDKRKKNE